MDALLTDVWDLFLFLFKNNGSLLLTLVGLSGLYLCRKHHDRMPRVSRRVSVASFILLLRSVFIPFIIFYIPVTMQFTGFEQLYKLIYLILEAIAFWLIMSVAFRDQ
tara:strand:- start:276 stop:596 length:321 start_codon:yes stop_codon:yes gene_type:complete